MTYLWHEWYRTAILETDWAKMQERLRSAELDLNERQRILSLDRGTPAERQAFADALNGLRALRTEVGRSPNSEPESKST
jgi:hypothetical protein